MSKGIIVVDIPRSCVMCDFCEEVNDMLFCGYPGIGEHVDDYIASRLDLCPIKPIPDRKSEDFGQTIIAAARGEGWNECLDEILGKYNYD